MNDRLLYEFSGSKESRKYQVYEISGGFVLWDPGKIWMDPAGNVAVDNITSQVKKMDLSLAQIRFRLLTAGDPGRSGCFSNGKISAIPWQTGRL